MNSGPARQLIDDLKARGFTIVAVGDVLHVRAPRRAVTEDLRDRLVEHKSALLDFLHGRPTVHGSRFAEIDQSPLNVRCFLCRQSRFWVSVYGVRVCANCHPPPDPSLVAEWIPTNGSVGA